MTPKATANLPLFFAVGAGKLHSLEKELEFHGLKDKNLILVTSEILFEKYKSKLVAEKKYFIEDSTVNEAERLSEEIKTENPLILAAGGGKVIDVSKYVATKIKAEYLSVPTTLSNDGIYSPVAVLTRGNRKMRFGANIPIGIVIDTKIVKRAPPSTIQSGVGDLIAKVSALKDWELAKKERGENINYFAYALSHVAVQSILNRKKISLKSENFLTDLAYSLVLCGLAMEISGSSRPCSGGEHSFSHALDYLYPDKSKPHGIQVAFGTLVTELLRGEEIKSLKVFFKKAGLPTTIKEFGFSKTEIQKAMELACRIRKRYTIFNKVKNREKFGLVVRELSK